MENVVFKIYDGGIGRENDVLAIWPDVEWDRNGNLQSYMHIGQHGGASPKLLTELPDATEEQAAPLKKELISIGYDIS